MTVDRQAVPSPYTPTNISQPATLLVMAYGLIGGITLHHCREHNAFDIWARSVKASCMLVGTKYAGHGIISDVFD